MLAESGCWLWTLSVGGPGYGNAWDGERVRTAHRYAYTWIVGPVPDGLVLDHLCKVRRCVNPAHLEPVTQGENMRRAGWYQRAVRSECPIHGAEFMSVSVRKGTGSGFVGICKECRNITQRAH